MLESRAPADYKCRFGIYSLATDDDAGAIASLLGKENSQTFCREVPPPGALPFANPLGRRNFILARDMRSLPFMLLELREYPVFLAGQASAATEIRIRKLPEPPGRYIGALEHGFIALASFAAKLGYPEHFFACVDASDKLVRRIVESGISRLPRYKAVGDMITTLYATDLGTDTPTLEDGYDIAEAGEAECWRIASLMTARGMVWNYAPAIDEKGLGKLAAARLGFDFSDILTLRHHGQIVGCVGVWDQRERRRLVFNRPPGSDAPFLSLLRLFSPVSRAPKLPKPGEALSSVYLPFFYMHPHHFSMAEALLRAALAKAAEKSAPMAMLSLAEANSLCKHLTLPGHSIKQCVYSIVFRSAGQQAREAGFTPQPVMALL